MSRSFRTGLVLLGVLSVLDLLGPLLTDGEHPPMAMALVGAVLGLVSLVLVVSAWRGADRAVLPLVVLRVLSAVTTVPAFFQSGVPGFALAIAAAFCVLTAAGVVLVLRGAHRATPAGAR